MRIGEPARKHDVADADIVHAVRHATHEVAMDDGFTMLLGAAADGTAVEVGVLDLDGDDPVVIHAMVMRKKYRPFLNEMG